MQFRTIRTYTRPRARENRCTGHNDESQVRTNSPVPPIPPPSLPPNNLACLAGKLLSTSDGRRFDWNLDIS